MTAELFKCKECGLVPVSEYDIHKSHTGEPKGEGSLIEKIRELKSRYSESSACLKTGKIKSIDAVDRGEVIALIEEHSLPVTHYIAPDLVAELKGLLGLTPPSYVELAEKYAPGLAKVIKRIAALSATHPAPAQSLVEELQDASWREHVPGGGEERLLHLEDAISIVKAQQPQVEHNYWKDVFKNADCFEQWANRDAFWEQQPYGTRFYFGDGAYDYINRGILQSAVKQLNQAKTTHHEAAKPVTDAAALPNYRDAATGAEGTAKAHDSAVSASTKPAAEGVRCMCTQCQNHRIHPTVGAGESA